MKTNRDPSGGAGNFLNSTRVVQGAPGTIKF